MKVLTVGTTGANAGLIPPALRAHGLQVRAMVRDGSRSKLAQRSGVTETVIADLRDPESLRRAVAGVDAVFHINPAFAPQEAEMGLAMVQAAADAGIVKFVFSSVYHPSLSALSNHADKQPVEAALYESGMPFVILQPAMFMQNLAGAWQAARASGRLVMPYSMYAKVCYVDFRDVAEAVAIAMTTDRLDYGTFELSAPGMVNRLEIAGLMSGALGQPIAAGEISVQEWLLSSHLPAGPVRDGLAAMMRHYDEHGFPGGNALVLRALLRREPRSLAAFINELAEMNP